MKNLLTVACITFFLVSCNQTTVTNQSEINSEKNPDSIPVNTERVELNNNFKAVTGEIIYLPAYSYIYHSNQQRSHNLSVTASFHNTDSDHSIIIKSVKYHDSSGNLLEEYITSPVKLKPLNSTNFYIEDNDRRGGIGGNFLIEWVAENQVSSPIAEAVMISTASTQGISFSTVGRTVKKF